MSEFLFVLKNKYIFLLFISISSSNIFADSINELDRLIVNGTRLDQNNICLLYTSPSPRDLSTSRMPSSA